MESYLFQNKSIIYEQYRPDYPDDLVTILKSKSLLKNNDIVAEFGCGTGKLTSMLLDNCSMLYGVEPDIEMFDFIQKRFADNSNLHLYNTSAEISNLPCNSFDVIISAQAFHLFNSDQAKDEFYRIINKRGHIILLWYFIDKTNPIAKEIRSLFYQYGAKQHYKERQKINLNILQKIFYPNAVTYQIVGQFKQKFSKDEFINSMLSSSYAPSKNSSTYLDYIAMAQSIYDKFSIKKDCIKYDFKIHLYTIQIN